MVKRPLSKANIFVNFSATWLFNGSFESLLCEEEFPVVEFLLKALFNL